ncbi:alpha/beta hydrolase [Paenibacillus dakarensis]|uniref:alpha/beta hydrolase n=1 Tax=Paenibacillus dakarensis TaxID=1527293 RepID=UPI0006D5A854|nr:dienelactone hydrolase family protein [Paenibacillus dakarensis]
MTVGRKVFVFKDISRIDPISKESREVLTSIYYPSVPNGNKPKYTTLFEPCTPLAVDMLSSMGVNKEYISNVVTGIYNNANINITARNCPIIVIAPAFGVVRDMYSFCVEHLVSCGYVVITMGATHESIFSIFPDYRFIQQSKEISEIDSLDINYWKQLMELRIEDIRCILSNIEEILNSDKDLIAIVDVSNIGIIGHSLGGAAAYEVLKREKKVNASVLLDPSFHLITANIEERVSVPLLVFRQEKCSFDELENEFSPELLTLFLSGYKALYNSSDINSLYIKLQGAHHMTFSDIPIHYKEDGIKLKHSILNKYISAFFDEYLKKKDYKFHELMKDNSSNGIDEINGNGQVI